MKKYTLFFILVLLFSSISYSQLEDFKSFSTKFYSDSVFQKVRIRFPLRTFQCHLKKSYYDLQKVTQKEWSYSQVDSLKIDSLKSESNIAMTYNTPWKLQHVPVQVICYKNGIRSYYVFQLIHEKWFLVSIDYLLD